MVGVYFKGRLGNQLFQFCFLQYLKSRKKGVFFFFPNPHHAYLSKYFDVGPYNYLLGSKVYSLFCRVLAKLINFRQVFVHNFVAPKHIEVKNYTIYNGYFQSDWYLKQLDSPLKISVKNKYKKEFADLYGDLFEHNRTIVVHIRRTDYLNYGKRDISISVGFFSEQLALIPDLKQYKVIFVSDDINFVKSNFGTEDNFIFSSNNEIIDFQLIQNADIAIISNSTFAWWAAYLNEKPAKEVIAPQNWMGFAIGREHPRGIMTDRFKWRAVPLLKP